MSVVAEARSRAPHGGAGPERPRRQLRWAVPTIFTALNAIAFVLVRPDVNDLWAARARASAVQDGVGLTYSFGWFGGSTPGNYSIFTPWLTAVIGVEVVGALAAVSATALLSVLLRGTRHPLAASALGAFAIIANLWSGRVPFLLGSAFGIAALIALRHGRRLPTVLLTVLSVFASPVTGAFLAVGLSGTFLTTRTREHRPIIAWAAGTAIAALLGVAVLFGTPGPEPFEWLFALEVLGALVLLWLGRPPDHIRTTLYVTALATVALFLVPNGMGSNISRLVFFCLPIVVVALSTLRSRVLAIAVVPLAIAGGAGTVIDLVNATSPVSSASYYASLIERLDRLPDRADCRVEVVDHGAHAGDAVLLDHVLLARGWETQENVERNGALAERTLDATTYKVWLDNNAVCYVALPADAVKSNPEYDLVAGGPVPYLTQIWHDDDWRLFRVADPVQIAPSPAQVVQFSQAAMTIAIPCACTLNLRIRWSNYLTAKLVQPDAAESTDPVLATLANDGSDWTTITTPRPGTYVLSGSLTDGLFR